MAWTPMQEELSGTPIIATSAISGVTYTGYCTSYDLSYTPISETLSIFLNSGFQRQITDYNISGTSIVWTSMVLSGENVFATYFYRDPVPAFEYCQDYEPITPTGVKASTTLSPVVTSYELLAQRVKMQLGWPMTNFELCDDQVYDFINQGCEWYSKYAGFTEEYLVFDSSIYQCGYGMKLDTMLSHIADFYCPYSAAGAAVSGQYVDCDTNNYRKVVGIFSADPAGGQGYSTEILFNMDYLFAQQAYFGQMMGGFGYDITTWHLLKSWMDLRKKMFASQIDILFNPQTQVLRLIPEPSIATGGSGRYIGVIGCRMEKSVRELVQERWVQRYALALTKISLAHVRGKFGSVTLFGGGTLNSSDIMSQGLDERTKLEEELMNSYGEAYPPLFFIE